MAIPSLCENARRTGLVKPYADCKTGSQKPLKINPVLGDSLTVEQRTLTPLVQVRILVPQPLDFLQDPRKL
jgi:hypothetical protein